AVSPKPHSPSSSAPTVATSPTSRTGGATAPTSLSSPSPGRSRSTSPPSSPTPPRWRRDPHRPGTAGRRPARVSPHGRGGAQRGPAQGRRLPARLGGRRSPAAGPGHAHLDLKANTPDPNRSERQGGRGCQTRRSIAVITIIDREAASETAAANEIITRRRRTGLPGRVTDWDRARLRALIELCRRGALTRSDLDERLDWIAEGRS